jgi:hypothetical protein
MTAAGQLPSAIPGFVSGFLRRQDHMKIAQKLKIALDETRMLVLGAQILIGFQFRGVFQDLYSELPAS